VLVQGPARRSLRYGGLREERGQDSIHWPSSAERSRCISNGPHARLSLEAGGRHLPELLWRWHSPAMMRMTSVPVPRSFQGPASSRVSGTISWMTSNHMDSYVQTSFAHLNYTKDIRPRVRRANSPMTSCAMTGPTTMCACFRLPAIEQQQQLAVRCVWWCGLPRPFNVKVRNASTSPPTNSPIRWRREGPDRGLLPRGEVGSGF
jgi:hypothetical protein